jgi:hypothetical protein
VNGESSSAQSDQGLRKSIGAAPSPGVFPKCRPDFEFARWESGAAICRVITTAALSVEGGSCARPSILYLEGLRAIGQYPCSYASRNLQGGLD